MRLALLDSAPKSQAEAALPAELRPMLSVLRELLPEPGDLLPAEDDIVMRLWPRDHGIDPRQVPSLLRRLVALGFLRRVVLGREVHLCLHKERQESGAPPKESSAAAATTDSPSPAQIQAQAEGEKHPSAPAIGEEKSAEHRLFQLQMIADVETERVLLFRVGIVLELLALLTLLRQILLFYLSL